MKRLVICCDGTWNTPDTKDGDAAAPSNVVKMARAVRPLDGDGNVQVSYYDEGVGSRGSLISRMWAGATGGGLEENVNEAYLFLVDNYAPGDELFFFGFSRGAFTVRSLAGMIRKCGLVAKQHADHTMDAYWLYRDPAKAVDGPDALKFRNDYDVDAKIDMRFLGVWDTVGALGIPWRPLAFTRKKHEFHDLKLSTYVANAFQALAIDEQRVHFPPAIWEVQAPHSSEVPVPFAEPSSPQRVEQTWFPGVHSNIGGGYASCGLSDIALKWMMDAAEAAGLALDQVYLDELAAKNVYKPDPMGFLADSRTGFYKLFAAKPRTIADPALPQSQETLSNAAGERWRGTGRLPAQATRGLLPAHRPDAVRSHCFRRRCVLYCRYRHERRYHALRSPRRDNDQEHAFGRQTAGGHRPLRSSVQHTRATAVQAGPGL